MLRRLFYVLPVLLLVVGSSGCSTVRDGKGGAPIHTSDLLTPGQERLQTGKADEPARKLARRLLVGRERPEVNPPKMERLEKPTLYLFCGPKQNTSTTTFSHLISTEIRSDLLDKQSHLGFSEARFFLSKPWHVTLARPYAATRSLPMARLISWAKGMSPPVAYPRSSGAEAQALIALGFDSRITISQRAELGNFLKSASRVCDRLIVVESKRQDRLLLSDTTGRDVWLAELLEGADGVDRAEVHRYWEETHGRLVIENRSRLGYAEYIKVLSAPEGKKQLGGQSMGSLSCDFHLCRTSLPSAFGRRRGNSTTNSLLTS